MSGRKSVKVSGRYQVSLPSAARKKLNIERGDRLLVDIQGGLLILTPEPEDYVVHLEGLHREIWEEVDSTLYLDQEREDWAISHNG